MLFYQLDSFTTSKFGGNPAAIVLVNGIMEDEMMQKIAEENNLSETGFIELSKSTDSFIESKIFKLRWFTPVVEVNLCGHGTLAAAHVLLNEIKNANKSITFATKSGDLHVSVDDHDKKIIMNFPVNVPSKREIDSSTKDIIQATIGDLEVFEVLYSENTKKLLVRLKDDTPEDKLKAIKPKFAQMLLVKQEGKGSICGVSVTLKGNGKDYDFCSRYFNPWVGINEDPVNGSSHTLLTPYWTNVCGKEDLVAKQCSAREGILYVKLRKEDNRVNIGGYCVTVIEGTLRI